jgi:shikimate dehydrogenase
LEIRLSIHCLPHYTITGLKSNGIDAIYEKQKLDDSELRLLIEQLKKRKIDGVNVTVPYKKAIIPFLDELSIEG